MHGKEELRSQIEKLLPEVVLLQDNSEDLLDIYSEIQIAYENNDTDYLSYMLQILGNHKRFMLWQLSKWAKLNDESESVITLVSKMKQEFIAKIRGKESQDEEYSEVHLLIENSYF